MTLLDYNDNEPAHTHNAPKKRRRRRRGIKPGGSAWILNLMKMFVTCSCFLLPFLSHADTILFMQPVDRGPDVIGESLQSLFLTLSLSLAHSHTHWFDMPFYAQCIHDKWIDEPFRQFYSFRLIQTFQFIWIKCYTLWPHLNIRSLTDTLHEYGSHIPPPLPSSFTLVGALFFIDIIYNKHLFTLDFHIHFVENQLLADCYQSVPFDIPSLVKFLIVHWF